MIYELKFPSEQRIYKRRIIETNWDKNVRVFNVHPVLGLGVRDMGGEGAKLSFDYNTNFPICKFLSTKAFSHLDAFLSLIIS